MNLKEMKNEKKRLVLEKQSILDKAVNEVRSFSPMEKESLADMTAKIDKLERDIVAAEAKEISNKEFTVGEVREITEDAKALDNEFENFMKTGLRGEELRGLAAGSLNSTTTDTMGVVIPTHISDFIIQKMTENSDAFAEASKFASVTGKYQLTVDDEADDEAMIVPEGTDFDDFKKLKFKGKLLDQLRFVAGYVLTQQLINNSKFDLVAYATEKMARKMARKAEQQIFQGTGTDAVPGNQFRGLDTNANLGTVDIQGAAAGALLDKLNELYNTINPTFLSRAKWYMTRAQYNVIAKLKTADGQFYVQNGVVNGKLTMTLFEAPIVVTEMLSTKYPIYFGVMSEAYAIMIKKGMNMQHIFADTQNAVQGTHMLLLDIYMDGCVYDEQAMVRAQATA